MAFCLQCGVKAFQRIPKDDNRPRLICAECGYIHYENPRNVVGCILEWQGRVLLCRRGIEPRKNYWTLPAGYLENGETLMEGAARECREEAEAVGEDLRLYGLYSLARINQVYVMFRGILADGHCAAGEETLEVALLEECDIPWDELAFPIVSDTLRNFFKDRLHGEYPVRNADIAGSPGSGIQIVQHQL